MKANLSLKDMYSYFRMALVTGIVEKAAVIAWADNQLLLNPQTAYELVELSLAGSQSYSQIIWLLNSFGGGGDFEVPLKLLFARAGLVLEQEPGQAREIVMGLRLLNEEEYFPEDVRHRLIALNADLERYQGGEITYQELIVELASFLKPYQDYRALLTENGL